MRFFFEYFPEKKKKTKPFLLRDVWLPSNLIYDNFCFKICFHLTVGVTVLRLILTPLTKKCRSPQY